MWEARVDFRELDALIEELEQLVYHERPLNFGGLETRTVKLPMGDFGTTLRVWRPAWDKARIIQEGFKEGTRYPVRADQEAAWQRFNAIRNDLSERSNKDREWAFTVSKAWRDSLLSDLQYAGYSRFADMLFFFDPTTVEEMKTQGARVKAVGQLLSENKHQIFREHKDEVFARIQEVRQTHDAFWGEYNKQREVKKQEYRERIAGVKARVQGNISSNLERREKAVSAYEHSLENIEKLEGMLATARGAEFQERVSGWLSEAIEKRDSILTSIRRIDEWIAQDRSRLSDIASKQ
jgi:hypothetical protein